jgi:hypothetical protein
MRARASHGGEAVPWSDSTRVCARLKVGEDPDRWSPPISERRRGEKGVSELAGRGTRKLGRAEEGGKRIASLGRATRRKKRGKKKKERVGRAQLEKREKKNCIQMHLNLNLKFKFKWKTSN